MPASLGSARALLEAGATADVADKPIEETPLMEVEHQDLFLRTHVARYIRIILMEMYILEYM